MAKERVPKRPKHNIMANWSNLPQDVLIEIAKRLTLIEDYLAFRGVCISWRSAGAMQNFDGSHQFPWLMLKKKGGNSHARQFFNPSKKKLYNFVLPEISGIRCIETQGWLFISAGDGKISLFNPISRAQIKLPPRSTVKGRWNCMEEIAWNSVHVKKAVLSSSPTTSDYALMVIHGSCRHLALWKPGDWAFTTWTNDDRFEDITYHNGKFYAINRRCLVTIWNVGGAEPVMETIEASPPPFSSPFYLTYIVESSGKLLVVQRYEVQLYEKRRWRWTTRFDVYQFDNLNNQKYIKIKDLGSRALFLGQGASFSVDASEIPRCKSNAIYFTDDYNEYFCWEPEHGAGNRGIYNMQDIEVEPLDWRESYSPAYPPIWVRPVFF